MGGAAGRTVSLHGIYGINDGDSRVYGLCQLKEHPGEVFNIRKPVVHLRLFKAGDGAEEIFDPAGITGHGMGLQLGDVDHIIGIQNGCDDMKAVVDEAFPAGNCPCSKVHIEMQDILKGCNTAGLVEGFHIFGIVESAGAFRKRDIGNAMGAQISGHAADHNRMGRDRINRAFGHDKIGLDGNLHTGTKIIRNREGIESLTDGRVNKLFFIIINGI